MSIPYFDRFDICEAYYCFAHDYGEYHIIDRLVRMGFKPRPSIYHNGKWQLTDNGKTIYRKLMRRKKV